jgi:hypothetical protein
MAPSPFPTRRLIFAAAAALALAVAPAVEPFAGPAAYSTPHTVADSARCTSGQSKGSSSIACVPANAPDTSGVPDSHPGYASPTGRDQFGLGSVHGGLRL